MNVAGTPRGWGEFKLCYPEKWFPSEVEVFECCGHPEGLGELKLCYPQKWIPSEVEVFECCGHPEGLGGGVKVMLPSEMDSK